MQEAHRAYLAGKIRDLYNKLTSTKYHNGSLASRIFGKTYNNPL